MPEFVSKPKVKQGIVPTDAVDLATKGYVDSRVLDDIANVSVSGAGTNNILVFNGTNWVGTDSPTVAKVSFNTSSPGELTAEGQIAWNDLDRALAYRVDGITLDIGQENVVLIRNNTGAQLNKGTSVCISGSSANRLSVVKSDASPGQQGCRTLGLSLQDIPDNNFGFVSTFGLVRGLDTSAFDEGDELFISTTPGVLSKTPPVSPARRVTVGYVVTKHANTGAIFVTIRRGLTVDELDNVTAASPADEDLLMFDEDAGVWKAAKLTAIDGGAPDTVF